MIDLRSDSVTKPTNAMRDAMSAAEVGDDERDGDPTTRRLEDRVAAMLGFERGLFFPSGVMANQVAIHLLSRHGTEILVDAGAHIVHLEMAGAAALSGVQIRSVPASAHAISADDLRRAIRPPSRYVPEASLVCIENTHNAAGGAVTSPGEMRALANVARAHDLPVHLDGARLWNASVACGASLADLCMGAETVMVDFSKGLGAPVGAALVIPERLAENAWRVRKRFGGAMRQSGILAAAALYALDHHLERLAEDHANARMLAELIDGVRGVRVVSPETNIVMVELPEHIGAASVVAAARERGVLVGLWSPTRLRAVTHLDVGASDVRRAGETLARVLEAA